MKGAPERILNLCDRYLMNDKICNLNDKIRENISNSVMSLGSKGERVLGLAELILDSNIYNISIPEPILKNIYDDEIDESCCNENCIIVIYNRNT